MKPQKIKHQNRHYTIIKVTTTTGGPRALIVDLDTWQIIQSCRKLKTAVAVVRRWEA